MGTRTKICKVCGAEYEACRTPNPQQIFRWRDVACCPEHGAIYLKRVLLSRQDDGENATKE